MDSLHNSADFYRLRQRKFLLLYLPIVLVLFAGVFFWLQVEKKLELEKKLSQLERADHVITASLADYTHEVLGDILLLAEQHHLFMATAGSNHNLGEAFERLQRVRRTYLQMRYLDPKGRELVRTNFVNGAVEHVAKAQLQDKAHRPYFKAALSLKPGEVFVSRFDLNIEYHEIEVPYQPVIRFVAPVMDADGKHCGFLIINYLGSKLLEQIAMQSQVSGFEFHLLNADGYWLYAPAAENAWGFQLPHGRKITQKHPQLAALIKQGEGELSDKNHIYRITSIGVFDTLEREWLERYTPSGQLNLVMEEKPWRLLSVLDKEAINASIAQQRNAGYLLLLVVMLLLWPICRYWGNLQAKATLYNERIHQLAAHAEKIQEQKRADVAREIHDEIGSLLTALRYDVESYNAQFDAASLQNKHLFLQMQQKIQSAVDAMRRIINGLRPAMLDDLGLLSTIEWQLDEFERVTGIPCNLDSACEEEALLVKNPDVATTAFRIFQESLTNIRHHAAATQVDVRVSCDKGRELCLEIKDNGKGASMNELSKEGHYGILGMRERTESLGGELRIDSRQGEGTSVMVRLPLGK